MAAQMANLRACPCQAPAGAAAVDKAWRDSRSTSSAFWRHSNPRQQQQQNWSTPGVQIKSSRSPPLVRARGRHNSSGDWEDATGSGLAGALHSTAHDSEEEEFQDELREECGVVGVMGSPEASRLCHLALHALQHRGQEGAGIAAADGGSMNAVRGTGLVAEVFDDPGKLEALPGACAIGHVRYATSGASALENVQPFVVTTASGAVAVAHNGNIVNAGELRARLEETGSIFTTSSDTEVVLHLMAARSAAGRPFLARVVEACEQLQGAYSMVFLGADQLVAVRDPHGFRPLVMGRLSGSQGVVFASETCALDLLGAVLERVVNPGEAVVVDAHGHVTSLCLLLPREEERRPARCVFELIYFSSPASQVFGRSVYASRAQYGAVLAEEAPAPCDVVVAVPDSGVPAAIGYAARAGVPYQPGLLRSHYVGRTFIQPSQELRDLGVKMKLAAVREVVAGKRVVVVDDSIVRGTTSSKIVRLLRDAGAAEVHMRIASPPIVASCYYGVDTPCRDELISYRLSVEETRRQIGADTLAFLPLERLKALGGESGSFCYACFSGNYPVLTTAMVKKEAATLVAPEVLATAAAAARSNPLRQLFSSEQQQQQPSKPAVAA